MRNNYFIIHKRALSLDSFRYTDSRQYIAKRDNGSLQCCVYSILPLIATVVGLTFLLLVGMALLMIPLDNINETNSAVTIFVAFLSVGIGSGLLFGDYRLMYAVGPQCFDGRRRFWFEGEQKDRRMLAQEDHPHRRIGDRK